jgi:hypothetical protein
MTEEESSEKKIYCNVTEEQVNESVEAIFDIMQLNPDLSDIYWRHLTAWLDDNDIEVIPLGSS